MSDFDAIDALLADVGPQAELPPPDVRRELREQARLSKAQVARALGVSPSTVGAWEGGRDPSDEIRAKYAYLLDGLAAKFPTNAAPEAPARGGRGRNRGRERERERERSPGRGRGRGGVPRRSRGVRAVRSTGHAPGGGFRPAPGSVRLPPRDRHRHAACRYAGCRCAAHRHAAHRSGPRNHSAPRPAPPEPGQARVPGAVRARGPDRADRSGGARRAPGRCRGDPRGAAEAGDPGRDAAARRDPQGRAVRHRRAPVDPGHPPQADLQGRGPDLGGTPEVDPS